MLSQNESDSQIMKELVCIVCPRGCRLSVDDENGFEVSGNSCPRGAEYGRRELTAPTRVIASTVRISGAAYSRCPVKTAGAIPKSLISDAMALLDGVELSSPVRTGDTVIENVLGTGVNFVVTRDM